MEACHGAYLACVRAARSAEQRGMYKNALEQAVSAFAHVDGMIQFETRYLNHNEVKIEAIDLAVKYVPLLLNFKVLKELSELVEQCKRITRTAEEAPKQIEVARSRMWANRKLWTFLERNPNTREEDLQRNIGGDQSEWRFVSESWQRMGLVRRVADGRTFRLSLTTRTGQITKAKCPSCGEVADGPKAMFFDELECPACHAKKVFVLLCAD